MADIVRVSSSHRAVVDFRAWSNQTACSRCQSLSLKLRGGLAVYGRSVRDVTECSAPRYSRVGRET